MRTLHIAITILLQLHNATLHMFDLMWQLNKLNSSNGTDTE